MTISNPILTAVLAFVPSLIGIIFNALVSSSRSEKLIRGVEICEEAIIEEIKKYCLPVMDHFKNEINRILMLAFRKARIKDIQSLELNELKLDFQSKLLRYIKQANKHIKKLESAQLRIKVYRWIFFLIIVFAVIEGLFFWFWPNIIPNIFFIILMMISILAFLLFLYDLFLNMNSLIERIRREYGISI